MNYSSELSPRDIYNLYLTNINYIRFTPREIDVMSCIAHGKSAKGTSHFLSSSKKTISARSVETHIYNIRRKINGHSKDSIVEFIENSDKYQGTVTK